ncbi:hypothetical protein [Leptospira vanthielii]|uniref:hypothetical protein n=1 Tax=Leptospira vanthielii TaxID=293085 RepID=UPI001FD44D53|nr:hypothetical protein [Leptospira vanthielii]
MKFPWFLLFVISFIINLSQFYFQFELGGQKLDTNAIVLPNWDKKTVTKKANIFKEKALGQKTSEVYIKPHPPDFLKGRKMKIQRFNKYFLENREYWKLEEIDDNGKVKEWIIDTNSIVW